MTQRIWSDGDAIVFAGSGDGIPHRMFPLGSLNCEIADQIIIAKNDANDIELRIHFSRLAPKTGGAFTSAVAAKAYLDVAFAKPEPIPGPPGPDGPPGPPGPQGPQGLDGFALPVGGQDGQALVKNGNQVIWSIPTSPNLDGGFF